MRPLISKPGFYPAISCADYFAEPCPAPALTNSGIKTLLASCPAKFAHEHPAIGQPEEERKSSAAMYLGSLVHRLALDKGDDYAISPFDEYRTKEARQWRAETEAAGLIPVKPADFEKAQAMAATIRAGIQQETRDKPYETEVVMAWQRIVNGVPIWCRGMIDVWCPELNLALDVKTIVDAGDRSINRAFTGGYAGQDAWYRSGIEAITQDHGRTHFGFLFVEKDAPHLARYAECDEAFRHGASMLIDHAAGIFANCLGAGKWPGFSPYIATPPVWWLSETSDLELEQAA